MSHEEELRADGVQGGAEQKRSFHQRIARSLTLISDPRSGRRLRAEEISERTLAETQTKIKKKLKNWTATANTIFPVGHSDHRASSDVLRIKRNKDSRHSIPDFKHPSYCASCTAAFVRCNCTKFSNLRLTDRLEPFQCGTCEYTYEPNPDDLNSTVN